MRQAIEAVETQEKAARGKKKFLLKKQLIEMRQDQYVIRNAYRKPIVNTTLTRSRNFLPMDEDFEFDDEGYVIPHGVSFMDPKVVSTILCNYSGLKEAAWGEFEKDIWFVMHDFDIVADGALKDYPLYDKIVEYKIDGL